jgi:hypothetical protein
MMDIISRGIRFVVRVHMSAVKAVLLEVRDGLQVLEEELDDSKEEDV